MKEYTQSDDVTKILSLKPEELDKIFSAMSAEEIDDLVRRINEVMLGE